MTLRLFYEQFVNHITIANDKSLVMVLVQFVPRN